MTTISPPPRFGLGSALRQRGSHRRGQLTNSRRFSLESFVLRPSVGLR